MYDALKFLHIAAAIVWIGSGIGLTALFAAVDKAGDRATLLAVGRYVDGLGNRLFAPAAMSTLIFGILTVVVSDSIGFTDTWIVIGLAGVAISMVTVALRAPVAKQIGPAVQSHGPDSAEVTALLGRSRMINTADVVLLLIVVAVMVFKPGA